MQLKGGWYGLQRAYSHHWRCAVPSRGVLLLGLAQDLTSKLLSNFEVGSAGEVLHSGLSIQPLGPLRMRRAAVVAAVLVPCLVVGAICFLQLSRPSITRESLLPTRVSVDGQQGQLSSLLPLESKMHTGPVAVSVHAKHRISILKDYPYSKTTPENPQSISCTDRGQDLKRELVYKGVVSVRCPPTCGRNSAANMSKTHVFGDACAFSVYTGVCLSAFYTGALKENDPRQPHGGVVSFKYLGLYWNFHPGAPQNGVIPYPWIYPDLAFSIVGVPRNKCPPAASTTKPPSSSPTGHPTTTPTDEPSARPTATPTDTPSANPSVGVPTQPPTPINSCAVVHLTEPKNAIQSSTKYDAGPKRASDGDTNGNFIAQTCTHTVAESRPER